MGRYQISTISFWSKGCVQVASGLVRAQGWVSELAPWASQDLRFNPGSESSEPTLSPGAPVGEEDDLLSVCQGPACRFCSLSWSVNEKSQQQLLTRPRHQVTIWLIRLINSGHSKHFYRQKSEISLRRSHKWPSSRWPESKYFKNIHSLFSCHLSKMYYYIMKIQTK